MPYIPKMDCPDCTGGTYEVIGRNGFSEVRCLECDGTGSIDASTCNVCDCRTDLHDGECPACAAAETVFDISTDIHNNNRVALEAAICNAITAVMASADWSRPVDPKIDLASRDPYHEFRVRGVVA